MKIMCVDCNNKEIALLNDMQKKVISYYIPASQFEEDMHRRAHWILNHKYEQCLKRFRQEWEAKLKAEGADSIPVDDNAFVQSIMARGDYKDREMREKELEGK